MNKPRTLLGLAIVWAVVAGFFFAGANRQRVQLNLSATAGGQYPYLIYAKGMAEQGWFGHVGDRNRMPLVPALLSLCHDSNWENFVHRAGVFAIGLSVLGVLVVSVACHFVLPIRSATAVSLFAVFCVFLPTAGFVQADRLYSALFFVSWLLLCGLLRKPSVRLAIIAGMTCGVCFLAKASIVYMLACFAVIALVAKLRRRSPSTIDSQKRGRSFLRAAVITTLVFAGFFAVSFPYLLTSKQRFGNWFYNVNTTYYFWCDSWREAKAFGDRYKTEEGAPNAPVEATPGPLRYWRTHTMAQIARRIWAGGTSLAAQVTHDRSTWFMIAMALIALFLLMKRPALPFVLRTEQAPILFTILVLVGYSVACAWYAQIAYGNRFISSLYLPVMGGLFWLIHRSDQLVRNPQLPNAPPTVEIAALYLSGGIIMHGLYFARYATHAPDRPFIQFYYDESRERELEGDLEEAGRGYQGVLQLDGGFAPAMHGLGMIALVNGQYPEALRVLARAVDYDPNSADLRNSLGSALFQSGRTVEAVEQFQKAIELDPRLPGTWLNLGGALAQSGDFEGAWAARSNLEKLDPSLARRLDQVIRSFEQK